MFKDQKPTYYNDYLKLDTLLKAQNPKSLELGNEAHEEMLFIIVHQAYELWFKQILHDLNFIKSNFNNEKVLDEDLSECTLKLERIHKIQGLLLSQIDILETMTPMDFLEFRDLLIPASGFQSVQFREIEIGLGINEGQRPDMKQYNFMGRLSSKDQEKLKSTMSESSLFALVEKWLERTPFLNDGAFDFWKNYKSSVEVMFKRDTEIIKDNETLDENQKKAQLSNLEITQKTFEALLDEQTHNQNIKDGKKRLSHKATQAALFILLYRHEPIFNQPFRLLNGLMTLDSNFTTWRYRHAQLAKRMLGTKIGTGGSSGHKYLKATADRNKIFEDFNNLSTFLIPKSALPKLPNKLKKNLSFHFSGY
jgi:tryptophan 2,3-dioxygenase